LPDFEPVFEATENPYKDRKVIRGSGTGSVSRFLGPVSSAQIASEIFHFYRF